jgi:DNA-binding SARP family transcriptional activator
MNGQQPVPVPELQFRVLGPLSVRTRDGELPLGPRKQQIVLATLLCTPNRHVSIDTLADAVWGDRPPRTARKNLHVYVCGIRGHLRTAAARDRIVHRDQGYVLLVEPGELDSQTFEDMSRSGAHLGAADGGRVTVGLLRQALDLWRGPAFEGLHTVPLLDTEAQRLSRRYLTVFETWAEAAVRSSPAAVIDEIEAVIQTDPYRERLRMIQMMALRQEGRQSEALAVFDGYRQALVRELGLPPSSVMVRLHDSLLADDEPAPPPAGRGGPCSLPREAGGLYGRAGELADLTQALTGHGEKLAVVTGPVGTGKTALALRCAHEVRASFPDGQLFVDARGGRGDPKPAGNLLRDLLRDAGVFGAGESTDRLRTAWQSWLSARRALVVLDDAPDEETVRLVVPRVGDSVVVVTSRSRLSALASAYRLSLGPLAPDDSLDLLARHISVERVDADRAAAWQIVHATGLLPVGIVVAGSKLASLRHLPLREFAQRLVEAESILDELCVGTFAVRPRLAAAVRDLPLAVRDRFGDLGHIGRPLFTLGQAAAAFGADSRSTGAVLEQLIEANLVVAPDTEVSAHEVVYQLPDLLYRFAAELARPASSPARLAPVA